jgi:hypothetical protein
MKMLLRAYSGEHGEIYMALVEFDPLEIMEIQDQWPPQNPNNMSFCDNVEWLEGGNMDVIDILDGGPMLLADDAEAEGLVVKGLRVQAQIARTECDEMVMGQDSVYWSCIVKHTDIRCETVMVSRSEMMTAPQALREVVDDKSRG